MTNNSLAEIAAILKNCNKAAVCCHVRPDGDALGSGLAVTKALENAGKTVYMLCEEQPPERLSLFPAMQNIFQSLPVKLNELDLFIVVDSADVTRIGCFAAQFNAFKGKTVNIDHHVSNPKYAKYNYVVPDSTATCEIMPEILEAAGFEITKEIADLLALGLLTDSGNFSHRDVSSKTFTVAAKLKERGADICDIGYEMFTRQTKARALLYVKVLNGMRFALEDKLAFLTVTQNDFEATGTDKSHTEGFVDFPLSIDGVEVSISLMEVKKNQYKASLRSRSVNVNAVAERFGGGGHVLASGCMLFGEYEEVIERLTHAVYQQL
ncbi:MAG: bifunctional oligoribonuclease/PAP phosphatase NrnA [Clostridia bacterium]|nr:bifunctional oligoribonuclease/PAP phosphatase NrnA [Clostridia bacterium]